MTNPINGSSARLDLIADLHRSDSTGNCTECHARRWPCDTFRHATGTTEPRTQRVRAASAAAIGRDPACTCTYTSTAGDWSRTRTDANCGLHGTVAAQTRHQRHTPLATLFGWPLDGSAGPPDQRLRNLAADVLRGHHNNQRICTEAELNALHTVINWPTGDLADLPPTAAQTHTRRCPHCGHPTNEHTRDTGQCRHDTGPWANRCHCTWNRRPAGRGHRETAVIRDETHHFHVDAADRPGFRVGDHITPAHMQAIIDRLTTPPPGEPAIPIHRAERNHWFTTTRSLNTNNDWITRHRNQT